MNRGFPPLFLPALGIVIAGLQISGLTLPLPPGVKFILAIIGFVLWPGAVLARRLLRIELQGWCMRFILVSILGISIASLLTWLIMIIGAKFTVYCFIMSALLILIYVIDLVFVLWNRESGESRSNSIGGLFSKRVDTALAGLALLIALYLIVFGVQVKSTGDDWDHVGYVRKIVAENTLSPRGVLADGVYRDGDSFKSDPRKGTLHPFVAFVGALTRIDPAILWTYLPVFLGPLALLSFCVFSLALLPGMQWVWASVALFLMFQGGIGGRFLGSSASGLNLSLIFFWVISSLSIFHVRKERNITVGLILLILLGGALVHIGVLFISLPMILSLLLFQRLLGLNLRRSIRLLGLSLVAASPVLLWKLASSYAPVNDMHMHPQGLLYFNAKYFVVSPMEILRKHSIVFLGGAVLLPGILFIKKHRREALLCGSLSFFPVIIAFNPFAAPLFYDKISYMLHRLVLLIPGFQLVVLVLGSALATAKRSRKFRIKSALAVLVILWAHLFFVPAIGALSRSFNGLFIKHERGKAPQQFRAVVEAASSVVPEGSVVVSDPLTSYALSAYRDVKVVAVLHQHGNPNDSHAMDRIRATQEMLSPFITQRKSLEDMSTYGVQYIVLNENYDKPVSDYMAYWNPGYVPELMNKYLSLNDNFRVSYNNSGVVILKVLNYDMDEESWCPTVPFLQRHEGPFTTCKGGGDEYIRVSKISIQPAEIIPGEDIKVTVAYDRALDELDPAPRKLVLRFENKNYVSRFGSYPGNKLVRRMAERNRGLLSRFTVAHNLMDGLYPPASWPIGTMVFEDFKLRVPSTMMEGEYEVQYKIIRDSLLPNFYVRDFLYNDDSLAGTACATLQIKKSLVR